MLLHRSYSKAGMFPSMVKQQKWRYSITGYLPEVILRGDCCGVEKVKHSNRFAAREYRYRSTDRDICLMVKAGKNTCVLDMCSNFQKHIFIDLCSKCTFTSFFQSGLRRKSQVLSCPSENKVRKLTLGSRSCFFTFFFFFLKYHSPFL